MTLSCYYNFIPYYIIFVAKLPEEYSSSLLVIGEGTSALTLPIIGFFSDKTKTRFGKKTPWYIGGFVLIIFSFSFIFQKCYFCNGDTGVADYYWEQFIWHLVFVILYQVASSCIRITHFSLAPIISLNKRNKDFLLRVRTFCTFFSEFTSSGISIIIFQTTDTTKLEYILYPSICVVIGLITSIIFICILNEPAILENIGKYKYDMKLQLKKHTKKLEKQKFHRKTIISHNENIHKGNKLKDIGYDDTKEGILSSSAKDFPDILLQNKRYSDCLPDFKLSFNPVSFEKIKFPKDTEIEEEKPVGKDIKDNKDIKEIQDIKEIPDIKDIKDDDLENAFNNKKRVHKASLFCPKKNIMSNSKFQSFLSGYFKEDTDVTDIEDHPQASYVFNWFRHIEFYLYGIVNVVVNSMVKINSIYLPLFMIYHFNIENTNGKTPYEISIGLLIMNFGSMFQLAFIQTIIVKNTNRKNNRVILMTISFFVMITTYLTLYFISEKDNIILFYFLLFPVGIGIAQALSTSTCLINDVIGGYGHEGAFVFGFYFFITKVILAVSLAFLPTDRENMEFIRHVLYFLPIIVVTISVTIIIIKYIFKKRKSLKETVYVSNHSFLDNSMFTFE